VVRWLGLSFSWGNWPWRIERSERRALRLSLMRVTAALVRGDCGGGGEAVDEEEDAGEAREAMALRNDPVQ